MISLTETSTQRLKILCNQCNVSAIAIQIEEGVVRFRLRDKIKDDFVVELGGRDILLIDYVSMVLIKGALLDFIMEKNKQCWVLECPGGIYYG